MAKSKASALTPEELKAKRQEAAKKARSAKGRSTKRRKPVEDRHERFAQEYAIDQNGTQAAIRAGYKPKNACVQAVTLLKNPKVNARVAELLAEAKKRAEINADWLVKEWETIASADSTQLSQFRRKCCPGCWESLSEEERKAKILAREIDPDCVNCLGEGKGYVYIPDTRSLTAEQKRLFVGVKQGKDGIEIKTRDQDKAQERLARRLGMDKQVVEHQGSVEVKATVALYELPSNARKDVKE